MITSSMMSQGGLYIHVYEVGSGSKLQGQLFLVNKANIIIVFLGYTCQKTISINDTFEIAGQWPTSQAYWVTLVLKRPWLSWLNFGIITMKQKLKRKKDCYSYVATATIIQFHFQFPRSPDAELGGLIAWLFNWKCKFSCRIMSNMANYLKYIRFLRWWRHR